MQSEGIEKNCEILKTERARYLFQVDGEHLLQNATPFPDGWPELKLECLPNRDSLVYEKIYGIENVPTIFRGTLRFEGFSSLMHVFRTIGLFGPQLFDSATSWGDLLAELQRIQGHVGSTEDFFIQCAGGDRALANRAMECLNWMHMTSENDMLDQSAPVIDLFCAKLEEYLQYGKDEHDMVAMHHSITAKFEDGSTEEHTSSLQAFGDDSMTAMCRTVGFPTAATTDLILRGHLDGKRGLLLPTTKDIYEPTLELMTKEGIVFQERVRVVMDPHAHSSYLAQG